MSEQVGASLVLAQMLLPSQAGSPVQNAPAIPGSLPESSAAGTANGAHLIDSIGESAPVFASLLTELKNLEARSSATTTLSPDALIRIRVETKLPHSSPTVTGTDLPEAGKLLPETGGLSLETGSLPALLTQPNRDATGQGSLPASSLVDAAEVVVQESGRPAGGATAGPAAGLEEPLPGPLTQSAAEPLSPQPSGSSSAAQPITAQPSVATSPETPLRAADGQPPPATSASLLDGSAREAGTSGDSSNGQQPGDRQGDRQTQPNLSTRGPAISFSLDGLASATVAAPSAQAGTLPTSAASLLSQPLTLLGQPAQWAQPLAERLAGLATRGANTAEIRLHPPSLGQLEVRITLANDQATLFVASANPEVREALQQALPRLDSLLNGLGIELVESEIAERQADGFSSDPDGSQQAESEADGVAGEPLSEHLDSDRLGLLDTWA